MQAYQKCTVKLLIFSITVIAAVSLPSYSKIDDKLKKSFENNKTVGVFITMKHGTDSILESVSSQSFTSRSELISTLVRELKKLSNFSQRAIHEFLVAESVAFQSFWISNQIYIPEATVSLVVHLEAIADVSKITEEGVSNIIEPRISEIVYEFNDSNREIQWGISKVKADRVWKRSGNTGEGVVVGIIDTGVRGSHQDLQSNFRTPYGWKDPLENDINDTPNDVHGHGTHCLGTIVGTNGIGIAPGAKWISCRGCSSGSCMFSDLLFCGQWMLCPTLPDGSQEDCSKAPHLVSNSWAAAQGSDFFNDVVKAWKVARIIPVFGMGNAGPVCNTARAPADSSADVIGVGATTIKDSLADFSSRGPSFNGNIKPDISAPGDFIYSSYAGADNAYATMSGTSMSTPHVSGAIALILSKNINLTYSEVKDVLLRGADTNLLHCDDRCGGVNETVYPNNCFGHGRLNVFNSVSLIR